MASIKKIIHGMPLSGLRSLKLGMRIVVWDHAEDKTIFVGKITRINGPHHAVGENYVHDTSNGKLTKGCQLDFEKYGVIPAMGSVNKLSPRYRTYALPADLAPADYKYFGVTFRTPEQIQGIEVAKCEDHRSKR
jgi:hypothetical protein